MEEITFKTNINCDACVAKVTPVLNEIETIAHWKVDTSRPEKILTIEGEKVDVNSLLNSLEKIGYRAEKI